MQCQQRRQIELQAKPGTVTYKNLGHMIPFVISFNLKYPI